MDTITHALCGAAIGTAFFSGANHRRAALIGAVLASLPDADMAWRGIIAHRAETHAFFYMALALPLLAEGTRRFIPAGRGRAWLMTALALFSHTILDILNSYGTQCLLPFSPAYVALDALPIVDPLLALPLLIALLAAIFTPAGRGVLAGRWAVGALLWSLLYCGWGLYASAAARRIADTALPAPQGVSAIHRANPLTGTTFIWRCARLSGNIATVGYIDVLRGRVLWHANYPHEESPRVREVLSATAPALRTFLARSQGLWIAAEEGGNVVFRDLRYGILSRPAEMLFAVIAVPQPQGGWQFVRQFPPARRYYWHEELRALWTAVCGKANSR